MPCERAIVSQSEIMALKHGVCGFQRRPAPQRRWRCQVRVCWSTWNVLCTYLFTDDVISANPMPAVGKPKVAKTLPKAFAPDAVVALLQALTADDGDTSQRGDWSERDRALVLTALLTGMRSDELIRADLGDIRIADDHSAMIHVRGKGNKDRVIPVEPSLIDVIEVYLVTRSTRFPGTKRTSLPRSDLASWPRTAPLFIGATGERISRGTLQYRIQRAYRLAGIDAQREKGALVHGLRHTYATDLANENVSVYTLMKLLGHESMATSQRYVAGAGADTRPAAAKNPIYQVLNQHRDEFDEES